MAYSGQLQEKVEKHPYRDKAGQINILLAINFTQFKTHFLEKGMSRPRARFSFTFFWTVCSFRLNEGVTISYSNYTRVLYCG